MMLTLVTDMRTLASILGHNEEVIAEKFKDVFPDKNIEAALIAMNNFGEMQTKAKQLVQIYHPNHTTDSSSLGACLMHTFEGAASSTKPKPDKPKVSNQHQLPQHIILITQNKADNEAKIGEVIKKTTRVPDKGRVMMDITVKIISGIVLKGQVEGEVEVKVEDLGLIIIIMGNPQIKFPNEEEEEIKIGEGVVFIIHNIISNNHMSKIITHPKDNKPFSQKV